MYAIRSYYDSLPVAGKHRPGASEPGRHLVADQENPAFPRHRPETAEVSLRHEDHPRRPLHERLHDHRRQGTGPLPDLLLHPVGAMEAAGGTGQVV